MNPARMGRLAKAPAKIASQSQGGAAGGDDRGFAATAAAGAAPKSQGLFVGPYTGLSVSCKIMSCGTLVLPSTIAPAAAQASDQNAVVRSDLVGELLDADRRRRARDVKALFDRDRNAVQWAERLAALLLASAARGLGSGTIEQRDDHGVEPRDSRPQSAGCGRQRPRSYVNCPVGIRRAISPRSRKPDRSAARTSHARFMNQSTSARRPKEERCRESYRFAVTATL